MRKILGSIFTCALALVVGLFHSPIALVKAVFRALKPSPEIENDVAVFAYVKQSIFSHEAVDKVIRFIRMQRGKQSWLVN